MRLYDYWRSSAAYRVRIALNLKGLSYEQIAVDLRAGAQRAPEFLEINPQGLVPVLEDDGVRLTQSLPILNYLEERYPEPALLPKDAAGRATSRAIGVAIACEIHPLNNLRVLQYLERELGLGEAAASGLVSPLDGRGSWPDRGDARPFRRGVLRWRYARLRRRMPGAAGVQRQALRVRSRALPDDPAHRRALPADRGVRQGRPGASARRRDLSGHGRKKRSHAFKQL